MAENLKTTKYRKGDPIPNVTNDTEWLNLLSGAYCDYENSEANSTIFGRLYNWYAVNDSRNIAPVGWHVSSDEEWTILIEYLRSLEFAGGKLKETGTTHWQNPNAGATNESGFTAIPGGVRNLGTFSNITCYGLWWSSTEGSTTVAWSRGMNCSYAFVNRYYGFSKSDGFSVRCLRD